MKKIVLVEIDVPDETGDLCWTGDSGVVQVFYDTLFESALHQSTTNYMKAENALNTKEKEGATAEEIEMAAAYRDYIKRKYDIITGTKVIGYLKDDKVLQVVGCEYEEVDTLKLREAEDAKT